MAQNLLQTLRMRAAQSYNRAMLRCEPRTAGTLGVALAQYAHTMERARRIVRDEETATVRARCAIRRGVKRAPLARGTF